MNGNYTTFAEEYDGTLRRAIELLQGHLNRAADTPISETDPVLAAARDVLDTFGEA